MVDMGATILLQFSKDTLANLPLIFNAFEGSLLPESAALKKESHADLLKNMEEEMRSKKEVSSMGVVAH